MLDQADWNTAHSSMLFKTMPSRAREQMLRDTRVQNFRSGETVFLQGDSAGTVYVVLHGWVKIYRVSPNGSEAVVSVFSNGQSFGEAVALRRGEYPVSAEAVSDCRLALVSASSLIHQVREEPELALTLVASTFRHLHELVGQVELLKARSGAQRVAEFLLELCGDVETGPFTVTLPYDKVLIAGRLGMKPESLSRVFSKLRDIGVDIKKNAAVIRDVRDLRDFCNQDRSDAWRG